MRLSANGKEFLLGYSSNVHPGESLAELKNVIANDISQVRNCLADKFKFDKFGLELRLGMEAINELYLPEQTAYFGEFLDHHGFFLFSINGFPLGNFHCDVVKEEVYRPDWSEPLRQDMTIKLCRILASLLPSSVTGTISTSPASYKPWGNHHHIQCELARGFAPAVAELDRINKDEGKKILLAIEPEPFCTMETVPEFIDFVQEIMFTATTERLVDEFDFTEANAISAIKNHVGINLDTCHLAVEFEEPQKAVNMLKTSGLRIAKLHVSAAARVLNPLTNAEGMKELNKLDEPKYLHQTFAVSKAGNIVFKASDLGEFLALPENEMKSISEVRTHFHMPLFSAPTGAIASTTDITSQILRLVATEKMTEQIVTETYTWPLMEQDNLHKNIAREIEWTANILRQT